MVTGMITNNSSMSSDRTISSIECRSRHKEKEELVESDEELITSSDDYVPETDSDDESSSHSEVNPLPKRSNHNVDSSEKEKEFDESQTPGKQKSKEISKKAKVNHGMVTVMTTNNSSFRSYDKPAYCYVCSRPMKKLIVHMIQHSNEPMVAKWLAAKKGPDKDKLWIKIRNYGNHLHNYEVLREGVGQLIVVYRPNEYGDPNDYQPCVDCLGYFSRNEFYRHKCKLRMVKDSEDVEIKTKKCNVKDGRMLLPPPKGVLAGEVLHKILCSLQSDDISRCIKGDSVILDLAKKLCFKHGHDKEQFKTLRCKLRELARLVLEYRHISGNECATALDLIVPSTFTVLLRAVRGVSGFDNETHQYRTPSLALKLGHLLKKVAMLIVCQALTEGNTAKEKQRCSPALKILKA
ncbi:uncharacterized protein LOC117112464 [Anneissia japonica]|uniref:uncharacterized protein LOC117112464 n=1 Tax=Anneissia japonica TaxID=1529436 RepID=UPI0014255D35|nr:uncharacterized protein LOC117112464 [Anneissia japonica]